MDLAIIFSPLIGSILSILLGNRLGYRYSQLITCLFILISAIFSTFIFYEVNFNDIFYNNDIFVWVTSGQFEASWSVYIDTLTSVMLIVVTYVSLLVHVYSIGYMDHDPHKPRFMSYLSLFTFAMLVLVTSNNFLQLFFGWEGVGLCSYLLIGFWYKKKSANNAAIKAFIVNRVGDFGLIIGIFLIFLYFDTIYYSDVFSNAANLKDTTIFFLGFEFNLITLICVTLFIGCMGKSAQIFLHTWLPDAMEGPTPVSALIHAATMVTAGVFLVARCSPIFEYSQVALNFVAVIGMITAFFAASVALVQNDIKRIIAYSTCSQLGYMFFACGVGAYHVAIFHLFTHAFFKSLLFLGSGSVIHSLKNEQDIRFMGGIWKKMPYSYVLMVIGTLALTGFPFFSGYYSKDAIIEFAYLKNSNIGSLAAFVGITTAFMTAIYSWRLIFKTFHGKYKNEKIKLNLIHESSLIIIVPLVLLSIGSIFSGYLFKDLFIHHNFLDFWGSSIFFLNEVSEKHPPVWFIILTPLLVISAIPIAYYLYIQNTKILSKFTNDNLKVYNFLLNKWYFDEIYNLIFVNPLKKIGYFFWKSGDINTIDRYGPNGISKIIKIISNKAAIFQSGYLNHYAFIMLIGLTIILTYLVIF